MAMSENLPLIRSEACPDEGMKSILEEIKRKILERLSWTTFRDIYIDVTGAICVELGYYGIIFAKIDHDIIKRIADEHNLSFSYYIESVHDGMLLHLRFWRD
ncbi:hypothetical protein [Candidatus Methanodesulfokora washburnensis]|uniref:hypothetical protein n=1 Tax=Candidatus Methanodesulfokora washburnensis TaxID=2478471 RepID=UPI000F77C529|nr:hypothetical protein [Candidatus Methanodesulfokores washburnensis]